MNKETMINKMGWIGCCILSLIYNSTIRSMNDDFVFAQGIERFGGFWKWMHFYAMNWSGRLIPHGILVLLLQLPNVIFIVLNSIMLFATIYLFILIFAPSSIRYPSIYGLLIICSLLFFKLFGLYDWFSFVIHWKCASVLYLWSITGFFLAIYPLVLIFRGESVGRFRWIMAYIGGIYSSSFEQMAAFMMIFLIMMTAWNTFIEKRHSRESWLFSIIISILSICFYIMPGNGVRSQAEVLKWLPYFGMLSVFDKIVLGLVRCLTFIYESAIVFIFISSVLELIIITKNKYCNKIIICLSIEPVIYYAFALLYRVIKLFGKTIPFLDTAFKLIEVDGANIIYEHAIVSTVVAVYTMLIFGCMLFFAVTNQQYNPIKPMFFFGGCGTIILMGFSPTIYASGARTSFICFALCLFILFILFWEIIQMRIYKDYKCLLNGLFRPFHKNP